MKNLRDSKLLVFDVESTSLHGSAFAVGAVVVEGEKIIDKFSLKSTEGELKACDWVMENVVPNLKNIESVNTDLELRTSFYEFLTKHKGCKVMSDCNFPVETNFLSAIATDNLEERAFTMPFPLYDISNFVDINIDRCAFIEELTNGKIEIPKHNPLTDSVASAISFIFGLTEVTVKWGENKKESVSTIINAVSTSGLKAHDFVFDNYFISAEYKISDTNSKMNVCLHPTVLEMIKLACEG